MFTMQKIMMLLVALLLVSCNENESSYDPANQIAISQKSRLNTSQIWPLNLNGSYVQKITASAWGKEQSFSVYLSLDNNVIEAVAFNDIAGRLYRLKIVPGSLLWEPSSYIPSFIKPENILADFLLVNLQADQLNALINRARVHEKTTPTGKIRTIKERRILRKITYSKPSGNMWGHVVIENPVLGYSLTIETVEQ
jgi:hypothetical protein